MNLSEVAAFNKQIKVIFVVGPTAAGKSRLALDLAQEYGGCIVNIDSVQFYQGLEIGSAAPTKEDLASVNHYLYSYLKAPFEQTAGQYIRDFYKLLNEVQMPSPIFIVGGTGFYIQALEKGMYNLPEVSDDIKSQVLSEFQMGKAEILFRELKEFDPASDLHINDHYRVGRALEVKRAFNLKMSEFKRQNEEQNKYQFPFAYIKIGQTFSNEKKDLFLKHVEKRTQAMLQNGIIDEVNSFLKAGFEDWAPLSSVGFLEVKNYLNNSLDQTELKALCNWLKNKKLGLSVTNQYFGLICLLITILN